MAMLAAPVIAIVCLLLVSAFFSGAETALTAASRARMHQLEKDGSKPAARVNRLIADTESLMGAIFLGRALAITLATVLATEVFLHLIQPLVLSLIVTVITMSLLVLLVSEMIPKLYALRRPDETAMRVARPVTWLVQATSGLVRFLRWVARGALSGIGIGAASDVDAADAEIRGAIDLHAREGSVDAADQKRLVGALDLKDLTVEDVMIHRKNIKMLDADMDRRQLVMKALSSPHTRLPLYRGEKEEIIGILHAKDLLRATLPLGGDLSKLDLGSVLRTPWFVPETTSVQDQLEAFLARRMHFALVVDEYGELQGLITLEDILEEIVGHIHDEHDVAVQGVRPQPDGSVNVDGWVPIRDLNRATGWSLPDDEAVTVAGLVIHEAQMLPEPGQSFVFHGYRFNVLRRQRNQVTGVNVSVVAPEPAPPET